ncbi:MAG TPA: GGDEF domain-containing protein [Terracidiphilus sp.]|nr:GGDEF domain-containing protein [Terracidiphilus sp.]
MRIGRQVSIVFVAMAFVIAGRAQQPAPLTTIHAIRSLSNAEASKGLPVAFDATVTYFRSYESTLFVQDQSEAIYIWARPSLALEPGDRIRVRGITAGDFKPFVVESGVTLLSRGAMPAPQPSTFSQMIQAQRDCVYVSVRGVVRSADINLSSGRHVTQLEIATDGGYVGVAMDNDDPERLRDWVDSEVEVNGVAASRFDGKKQQTGVLLYASSYRNLTVRRPAGHDPWSIPATPMDKVLQAYNIDDRTARVRVEGVLTYYHQTQMAVLQNGERSIRVLTPQVDSLVVGDRVEAIGIPGVEDGFLILRLGAIRSLGRAAPVDPQAVTWDELASGKRSFDLVSIEGTMVSQVREQAQDVYIVSANGHLFNAAFRHPFVYEWPQLKPPPPMPAIAAGSRVRVTGVAILDDGNPFNGSMAFGILLRSAGDVTVIARPSWLNVRNLMKIVTVLLAAIVVVGAWGFMLQLKTHRQTRQLAGRIESEAIAERRRGRILEDINHDEPIAGILEEITGLLSFLLGNAPCCCELADGTHIGRCDGSIHHSAAVRREISSRSGEPHGFLYAFIDPLSVFEKSSVDGLTMGASLAALAIESSRLHSDLVHRSEFDLLTDVRNRFSFEQALDSLIANAREQGQIFGLIYIDLDYFKQVNDRYGHQTGDKYLKAVSARMKSQLRSCDTLARLGGDEFAALVRNVTDRTAIEEITTRIEHCFDDPFTMAGFTIRGSASIGIAIYPEDGDTRDSLLNTADAAMYVAKQTRPEPEAEQKSKAAY